MNSLTPRSLSGQMGSGATALGAMMTSNPWLLAGLPLQSPRVVGSLAYGAGRMAGGTSNALQRIGGAAQPVIGGVPNALLAPSRFEQLGYQALPIGFASAGR
jgi:hypothetical protein